jgi:hypothetical protein
MHVCMFVKRVQICECAYGCVNVHM